MGVSEGTYYVLAGNYGEYKKWCEEEQLDHKEHVYIGGINQIKGKKCHPSMLRFVGTWQTMLMEEKWMADCYVYLCQVLCDPSCSTLPYPIGESPFRIE